MRTRGLWLLRPVHVAIAIPGLLGACADYTGPAEGPVVIRVLAVEASLTGAAPVIRYQIENLSSRAVFILACGDKLVAELEQRRPSWEPAGAAVRCQANLPYLPVVLRSGTAGEGNVTLPAPGTYRLLVRYRFGYAEQRSRTAVSAPLEHDPGS